MNGTSTCPHCGGEIRNEAVLCRHCRRELSPGRAGLLRGPWVRDPADKQLAGVSGMIGGNLGISPTIVRVLFLLAAIFGSGAGVWIYLVFWAATPLGTGKAPMVRLVEWVEGLFRGKRPPANGAIVPPERPEGRSSAG